MKIAIVTHLLGFRDGQGRVNYEIAWAALEAGHEVTMLAHECDETLSSHANARFIKFAESSLPTRLVRSFSFAVRSARWLRRYRSQFDVIQANGFVTFEPADVIAAHFVHSSWRIHPSYPFRLPSSHPYVLYQNLYTSYNAHYEPKIYGQARAVVAVSRKTAREVQQLGVDAAKIHVIYNGVDVDMYHPGPPDRARFGLPQSGRIALFVGDIRTARKNLDTVLRAVRDLPELYLAVAGDTTASPYPAMARELGISKRVLFLGKTSEVALLMRSVDILVFPSRYEAHPLVLMEALASGLPVIAASGVAQEETFADACLLLQNPNDSVALANLIAELLRSPAKMNQMASLARDMALQMTWSVTAGKYLSLYEEIVRTKCLDVMHRTAPGRLSSSVS